eukprot:262694-Chlamydomonas_euryale.AAC.4
MPAGVLGRELYDAVTLDVSTPSVTRPTTVGRWFRRSRSLIRDEGGLDGLVGSPAHRRSQSLIRDEEGLDGLVGSPAHRRRGHMEHDARLEAPPEGVPALLFDDAPHGGQLSWHGVQSVGMSVNKAPPEGSPALLFW